ncbi:flagellar hook-basal body complex protein [Halarcobacter ebronensis]|uniref:Flagellar hook protein FlgE n=1 Tax=Halarcobacter ebronensis TaxID=1462615 RepID=A0A4Q1AJ47_9BACT|nr:flagellar hook-basal body complex protein [Halarcobacter ebronensis]QKF82083.1 flagellar hook protein, epsilonproteobacterial variant [Halarcobacter ebronensis]RXK04086.1 flagellar biosynthesis protein FlgE [Halarcobacter ebronensis]
MIGALWTGISGLSAAQAAIDNESNNIANVNTVGYKASRVSFADLMYQDSIGKGATVTSAEKQYVQGSLNLTGSNYDLALNGDGFFVVSNVNATGTSETYYTRAGNLRMGDNGTLQDANGYEVQGWAMSTLDPTSDVISTNKNWTSFNDNFTEIAGNQIIKFSNKIETYAAKMTDYQTSAKSDSLELTGSGIKSKSSKISDIEQLITKYTSALEDYAENPNATSSPSIAQSSVIDFPSLTSSSLNGEKQQIYVYIDGNKYPVDYVNTTANTELRAELEALYDAGMTGLDLDGDGAADLSDEEYNILASRAATYKALADKISDITGLVAYTVDASNNPSTNIADVLEGRIRIDSINPGEDFLIGDVSEFSNSTELEGTKVNITEAVAGTGEGAVESAMNALRNAVAGKQYDVYEQNDIVSDDDGNLITWDDGTAGTGDTISFSMTIDGIVHTVTSTQGVTGTEVSYKEAVTDLISQINLDPDLSLLVEAKTINGKLVIESKTTGEEFTGIISYTDDSTATTYTKEKDLELSGNTGAGAEFMQIISNVDQETSKTSLQLKLDSLGLTDESFGEFNVDETGLITITQDGVDYVVGQIAIAQFANNIELKAIGNNLLAETTSSGKPIYTINNDNSTLISAKTLELSKADLSESLVNLMVFQRAFEANSKSITTADELLTTLIQLKR